MGLSGKSGATRLQLLLATPLTASRPRRICFSNPPSPLALSQHPQLRPQRLFDFVQQNAPDHLATEVNPRKRRHAGPQQAVAVFNRELNTVSRLLVFIEFAFAPDLGDSAVEDLIWKGEGFEANGKAKAHVAQFALRDLNADEEIMRIGNAANLRALLEVFPDHAR